MTMPPRTFTAWLKRQRKRDDRVGDLARDVARDPRWPPARTRLGFRRYLENRDAGVNALNAFEEAWAGWENDRGTAPMSTHRATRATRT